MQTPPPNVPQMQQENPRYRTLDRILARAYIELMTRWKASKKRMETGFLVPRMDLCDDPGNTHIVAMLEVPGMRREDFSVRIQDNRLIVEGERIGRHLRSRIQIPKLASPGESETSTPSSLYSVRELKYGKIKREIDLPAGVHVAQVHGSLAEGILTVSWPRVPIPLAAGGEVIVEVTARASDSPASI